MPARGRGAGGHALALLCLAAVCWIGPNALVGADVESQYLPWNCENKTAKGYDISVPKAGQRKMSKLGVKKSRFSDCRIGDIARSFRGKARYPSCAFVGNAGWLVYGRDEGHGLGKAIDSHHHVIRFNYGQPNTKVEQFIGYRETIRFVNGAGTQKIEKGQTGGDGCGPPIRKNLKIMYMKSTPKAKSGKAQKILKEGGVGTSRFWTRADILGCNSMLSKANSMAKSKCGLRMASGRLQCSQGMLGIFLIAKQCKKVTFYGFGDFSSSEQAYSYAKFQKSKLGGTHGFQTEALIIKTLGKEGGFTTCNAGSSDSCGMRKDWPKNKPSSPSPSPAAGATAGGAEPSEVKGGGGGKSSPSSKADSKVVSAKVSDLLPKGASGRSSTAGRPEGGIGAEAAGGPGVEEGNGARDTASPARAKARRGSSWSETRPGTTAPKMSPASLSGGGGEGAATPGKSAGSRGQLSPRGASLATKRGTMKVPPASTVHRGGGRGAGGGGAGGVGRGTHSKEGFPKFRSSSRQARIVGRKPGAPRSAGARMLLGAEGAGAGAEAEAEAEAGDGASGQASSPWGPGGRANRARGTRGAPQKKSTWLKPRSASWRFRRARGEGRLGGGVHAAGPARHAAHHADDEGWSGRMGAWRAGRAPHPTKPPPSPAPRVGHVPKRPADRAGAKAGWKGHGMARIREGFPGRLDKGQSKTRTVGGKNFYRTHHPLKHMPEELGIAWSDQRRSHVQSERSRLGGLRAAEIAVARAKANAGQLGGGREE